MKQISVIMFIIGSICIPGFAQDVLQPEWSIRKASPLEDSNAEAWGIDADSTGNLYWATNQARPGILQGLDVVFYKLDGEGNELWPTPTVFGGQHTQQIYKVTADEDIVYLTGRNCTEFTLDPDLPFCDALIMAVDAATGDTLWTTTWDRGFGYEEGDGLVVKDDGIYVSGWSVGDGTDTDLGLLKLDFDGSIQWTNAWGTDGRDHQDGHSVVDDSVIFAAGLLNAPTNPGICLVKEYNGQSLLAKFSREDGGYLDHVTFGRDDPWCNFENALGMATDGQFLFVVGVTSIAANDLQIFLKKFDKNLNMIWETEWGGGDAESARAIAVAVDGNIYIGGNTKSFGAGGLDVALVSFTPNGDLRWYQTWGGAKDDQVLDIKTTDRDIYITGKAQSFHPKGKTEAFLLKVKLDKGSSVTDRQAGIGGILLRQNYPNPFNPSTAIHFVLPAPSQVLLRVYNLLGQEVATLVDAQLQAGEFEATWNVTDMASGIYLYRLQAGEHVQVRKMVLSR